MQERALELAAQSDRPADAKGVALTPLQRTIEADALRYGIVTVEIDRAQAHRHLHRQGARRGAAADDRRRSTPPAPPGTRCRWRASSKTPSCRCARNELEIGTWLIKTEGDAAAVLAIDATLLAHKDHWLVRETIGLLRRTFSRLDVSSRSLFALIEPGSCFAGSLLELALACDRSYHLALPDDPKRAPKIVVSEANFGLYPMVTGQTRLGRRFYDEQPALDAVRARAGQALDADAAFALGLVTSATPTTSTGPTKCASRSRSAWRCRPTR